VLGRGRQVGEALPLVVALPKASAVGTRSLSAGAARAAEIPLGIADSEQSNDLQSLATGGASGNLRGLRFRGGKKEGGV